MLTETGGSCMGPDGLTPRVTRLRERLLAEMLEDSDPWNLYHLSLVQEDPALARLSPAVRYALAIARTLREMPIRIADDEIIVGNIPRRSRFTLVPLPDYLTDDEKQSLGPNYAIFVRQNQFGHYAANYAWLLQVGLKGVRDEARASLTRLELEADEDAPLGREFCKAVIIACDAVRDFAARYATLAGEMATREANPERRRELHEIAETCRHVPENLPRSFREALQSVFLYHAVLQNFQHDAACGRLDQVFWPAFRADLDSGRLTLEEAQELIDCFVVKLNDFVRIHTEDWWGTMEPGLQNVVLGGQTADGKDAANELTYLFLNSLRRLRFNNPTISVRLYDGSPERLVRACCELLREGGGFPALYNDEVFIPGLLRAGVLRDDAYDYANDGCWETTIPGKTRFAYSNVSAPLCLEWTLTRGRGLPIDWRQVAGLKSDAAPTAIPAAELSVDPPPALVESEEWRNQSMVQLGGVTQLLAQVAISIRQGGVDVGDPLDFATFEELFDAFCRQLDHAIGDLARYLWRLLGDGRELKPNVVGAALVSDCVARGRGWTLGGPRYSIFGFNVYGIANAADSLLAIQKLVYEDRRLTIRRLVDLLRTNFEDAEAERQLLLTRAPRYGDGSQAGIAMAHHILSFVAESIDRHIRQLPMPERHRGRALFTLLSGTFGNTIMFGRMVGASPDGRPAGHPLAVNLSPVVGASSTGPTAILRSYAQLPLETLNAGAPLDLTIDGASLQGEAGLERLMAFVRAFVELRGNMLTVNFVDAPTLRRAQQDPHSYRDLRVRMGGWNAYFVGLNREEQEHQIARAEHRAL